MAQKKKNNKKIWLVIIIILLFIGVGAGCYFLLGKVTLDNSQEDTSNNIVTETVKTANIEKTEDAGVEESEVVKEDGIEVVDENDPNNSSFVTGEITYSGFKGDKYKITVVTDQALSEGECSLSLNDKKVAPTVEVVAHPNSSSCVFNLDEIDEGSFNAEIVVTTTGGREGVITGKIEVAR